MGQFLTNYGGYKAWWVFEVSRRGEFSLCFLLQSSLSLSLGSFAIRLTLEQATKVQMGSRCIAQPRR